MDRVRHFLYNESEVGTAEYNESELNGTTSDAPQPAIGDLNKDSWLGKDCVLEQHCFRAIEVAMRLSMFCCCLGVVVVVPRSFAQSPQIVFGSQEHCAIAVPNHCSQLVAARYGAGVRQHVFV